MDLPKLPRGCEEDELASAEKDSKEINSRWLSINSMLTAAISKVEGGLQTDAKRHELELANIKAQIKESLKKDHDTGTSVPRIASDLRPEKPLELAWSPVRFNIWLGKFGDYIRANKISTFSKPEQISYAKTLISDDLWTLNKSKIMKIH